VAALALVAVLTALSAAGTTGTATAAPAAQATETDLPVQMAVTDLLPRAPRPGQPLQVLGTLVNDGTEPLSGLQVRVRVGDRLSTRGQLRDADRDPPSYGLRDTAELADLLPGASAPLDVRLPVDRLRLGDDGVYPLQIEVRGVAGNDRERQQLGAVSTYLPWFGDTQVDPLRVAWIVPLVDQPRLSPRGVLLDDELATSLAPAGRLGRLVAGGRQGSTGGCPPSALPAPDDPSVVVAPTCGPVPVTWAVDPDLLFTADTMTRPYQVAAGGGRTRDGEGTSAALSFLAATRQVTADGAVLALPYADPDVVALTRAGTGLAADVAAARSYGVTVTRDLLGADPLPDVALPPEGALTDSAFDALTTSPTRALVLGAEALDGPVRAGSATPGARVAQPASATSGPVTGLVPDAGLSALLVPDQATWQGPRLAEQRFLAETAMIAAELPNRGRTLLVTLPRRAVADPDLLAGALADTGRVPWTCPVALAQVVQAVEACPGRAAPSYEPERDADLAQPFGVPTELDGRLLARLQKVRADADQFTGAVVRGGTEQARATRARLQRGRLRVESSAWRDERGTGARLLSLLADDVAEQRSKVKVLTGSVTLTSRNGRVSVLVVNELDQPVTVALRLQAPSDARLSRTQTATLEVPGRNSQSVDVVARTLTSGRFVVLAQLVDRDGHDFGPPQDLLVRSTRYGTVALAVTGLGAGVLLAAAGVRLARRALRRR